MNELNLTLGQLLGLLPGLFLLVGYFWTWKSPISLPEPMPEPEPPSVLEARYGAYVQLAGRRYN